VEKIFAFKDKAQEHLYKGIKTLSKAVKSTLGPTGKNVLYNKNGRAVVTKNGFEVAQQIILENSYENMGAKLLKEAAQNTQKEAGDGTTTSIVLAEAMIEEGVKLLLDNIDASEIKRGMDRAVKALLKNLSSQSKPIKSKEDLFHIATMGANNDRNIGRMLSQALEVVGKDGLVTFSSSPTCETSLEIIEGMQIASGYLSPYFATNPQTMTAELKNPYILIIDQKIEQAETVVPILEKLTEKSLGSLVIIAKEIVGKALETLTINKVKKGLPIVAIKAPESEDHQELLQDIASLTGATVIKELASDRLLQGDTKILGKAKSCTISKEHTLINPLKGEIRSIESRKEFLREEIKQSHKGSLEELQKRLGSLSGVVAHIKIGAATNEELLEKKALFKNALNIAKAAMQEGVVTGEGVALLKAAETLDTLKVDPEEQSGVNLIKVACKAPLLTIASNSGEDGKKEVEKILKQEDFYGYNAAEGQYSDLFKDGIVDPVIVVQSALKNAASVASTLLTCILMITENLEK